MANGLLGSSAPNATTNTTVYTVPAGKTASFTVNICNRSATAATVRLAIAATSTPGNTEWLEYETTIGSYGVLEKTGLVAQAGKLVVVYASANTLTVNVYGFEE